MTTEGSNEISGIISFFSSGDIFGMLIMAPMADVYGRRAVILAGGVLVAIFSFASALSPNIYYLIVARMLVGVGIGASNTVLYDLFAETVPTIHRNLIGYLYLFVLIGSEYVILSCYFFLTKYGWRITIVSCSIPILIVVCVGYIFIPESPRWLVSIGKHEEAKILLQNAALLNGTTNVVGEIIIVPPKGNEKMSYNQLFFGHNYNVTAALWLVWLLTQFAHSCVYFTIINSFAVGQCDYQYGLLALIISLQTLGIVGSTNIMNYLGRVSSQMCCFTIASAAMLLYGLISVYGNSKTWAISMLSLSQIASLSGISVLWVHTVELFPTEVHCLFIILPMFLSIKNSFIMCFIRITFYPFLSTLF